MIPEKEIIDSKEENFEPRNDIEAVYGTLYAIIAADGEVTDEELEFVQEAVDDLAKKMTAQGEMSEAEYDQFLSSKQDMYKKVAKGQEIFGSETMMEKYILIAKSELENLNEQEINGMLLLFAQTYFSDHKWWSDIGELTEEHLPDDYLERKKDKTIDAIYFFLRKLNIDPSRFKKAFEEGRHNALMLSLGIKRAKKEREQKRTKSNSTSKLVHNIVYNFLEHFFLGSHYYRFIYLSHVLRLCVLK